MRHRSSKTKERRQKSERDGQLRVSKEAERSVRIHKGFRKVFRQPFVEYLFGLVSVLFLEVMRSVFSCSPL